MKTARFLIAASLAGLLAACSGLLGLTDPALDTTIGADGGGSDGSGDAAPVDGGGSDAPPTCTADLTSDPKNCGSCNHDCLGGACSDRTCQPVLVVEDKNAIAPEYLVESADTLYFSNTRPVDLIASVAKIPKTNIYAPPADGGAPAYTVLGGFDLPDGGNLYGQYPYELSVSGGTLYVSVNANAYLGQNYYGGIMKCSTTSCDTSSFAVPGIDSLAVVSNGTFVVYAGQHFTGGDKIFIANPDLTAPTEVDIGGGDVGSAQIDGSRAFVASPTGVYAFGPSDSSGVQLSDVEAERLSISNGYVYFTSAPDPGTPAVLAVPTVPGAGNTITITSGKPFLSTPIGIAADSDFVYIADEGDFAQPGSGQLIRCPIAGCGADNVDAVILSTGAAKGGNPRTIVNDIDAIYWGNRVGQIWKLAK